MVESKNHLGISFQMRKGRKQEARALAARVSQVKAWSLLILVRQNRLAQRLPAAEHCLVRISAFNQF